MTRAELLEVVYRFYPRGLDTTDPGHHDTEEAQRQRDAVARGAAGYPTWKAMLGRLEARYPVVDDSPYLLSGVWYSAYSASIEIPGRKLGFHVSLLGPYYGIHRTGLPIEERAARDLGREIEATYPGYAPIPPGLGDDVVPDVSPFFGVELGKATIYVCLLSDLWNCSSEPWPPPEHTLTEAERDVLAPLLARAEARRARPSGAVIRVIRAEPREPRDGDPDREAGEPPDDSRPDEPLDTKRRPPGGQ
jgi:hypothetical protein